MAAIQVEQSQSYVNFSRDLMAICALHGKTNREIAEICEVSEDTVALWRTGRSRIPIASAYRISESLGIKMNNLLWR